MKKKFNLYFSAIILAASLWGTAGIFVRAAEKTHLTQMDLVFWRALLTSLILGIIIALKDIKLFKIKLKDTLIFALAGLSSIVLFNFSYYKTMSLTTLSVAAVLLYTAPFFVMLISLFLFKEKIGITKICALLVAFSGCCLVTGLFDSSQRISAIAVFFGLLTGFGYALYTIFGRILLNKSYHTLTITFYIFLFAAIFTLPFIKLNSLSETLSSPNALLIVFLMAVFNTVIPYILYTSGLKGVSPSAAPIIATIEPVVATLMGILLFKENLSVLGVIGIALVIASVVILNIKPYIIRAYAKINLALTVKGKQDNGYHILDMVMQSISLYDTVYIKKNDKIIVECSVEELSGEQNIAYKAALKFFEFTKIRGGAKIYIKKRIPEAAGLGGGSADAAAVLMLLNRLYKTDLSDEVLEKIALEIGADVPFCIKGGTQKAEGVGEILSTLNPLKKGYFVIVKEGTKPSTGEMYKKLDSMETEKTDISPIIEAINEGNLEFISDNLYNSFEAIWPDKHVRNKILTAGAMGVCLSGSGPSYYGIFKNRYKAKRAYKKLKKEFEQTYMVTPTDENSKKS